MVYWKNTDHIVSHKQYNTIPGIQYSNNTLITPPKPQHSHSHVDFVKRNYCKSYQYHDGGPILHPLLILIYVYPIVVAVRMVGSWIDLKKADKGMGIECSRKVYWMSNKMKV